MKSVLLAAVLAFTVNAAAAHDYKAGSIEIKHPWSRATPKGASVAGGYLKLINTGSAPDRLVGGTNAADLSLADVYLLPSVACVIIGGTSIFGGRGGYSGTIVGALILTALTSILTLLDVPEPVKQILYGAIILSLAAAYARLTE